MNNRTDTPSAEPTAEPAANSAENASGSPAPLDRNSPGAALAHARRGRRMEVGRIATELRLKPATIEALERDDYAQLPSAVFIAGYIRSYARLLDLDPEPLIERFRALHPDAEAPPPRVVADAKDTLDKHGSSALLLVGLLLALAVGGGYFWWVGHRDATTSADFSPAMTAPDAGAPDAQSALITGRPPSDEPLDQIGEPAADPASSSANVTGDLAADDSAREDLGQLGAEPDRPQDALDGGPKSPDQTATAAMTSADGDQAPTSRSPAAADDGLTEDDAAQDLSSAADAPTQAAGEAADAASGTESETGNEVQIAFSGPCWVDVRDSTGEVLLFGEMGDGDSHVLGGEPPYSLVIGNASVTEITIGGRPFDVRAVAKGNVARFELDPAERNPGERNQADSEPD